MIFFNYFIVDMLILFVLVGGVMTTKSLNEIAALWNRVQLTLQEQIQEKMVYDSFFKDTYIYTIEGNKMIIACGSHLAASILHDRFLDLIEDVVNKLTDTEFKISFINAEDLKTKSIDDIVVESKPKFMQNCSLSPLFTFENFVVGPSNKEANQASLIVSTTPGKLYNPLFIYSQSGLGKTHLLNAIGNYIKSNNPTLKILYTSSQTFFEEYQNSIHSTKNADEFRSFLKSFDVLLVDDIQFFQGKKSTEEFFFNIFESMRANNKQIVLTSDRTPNELIELDPRLQTRFSSGLQISILKPTTETCIEILKTKISAINLPLSKFDDDVLYLLADKFKYSIRDLEGALNKLLFYSTMNFTDHIDMEVAVGALQTMIDLKGSKSQVGAQKILNIVASYYNISVSQLTGKIKTNQIVNARHIAVYLMRIILDLPYDKIGETFSNRDHSTIMYSVNKVEKMLKTDEQLKHVVNELKKRISS